MGWVDFTKIFYTNASKEVYLERCWKVIVINYYKSGLWLNVLSFGIVMHERCLAILFIDKSYNITYKISFYLITYKNSIFESWSYEYLRVVYVVTAILFTTITTTTKFTITKSNITK